MGLKTICFLLLALIAHPRSSAQGIIVPTSQDSLAQTVGYHLWLDGGFYFANYQPSRDWMPLFNVRVGMGKSLHYVQLDAFLELVYHRFEYRGSISSSLVQSGGRYDLALYGSTTIFSVFFAGTGIYYTHQANIVSRDVEGNVSQSGVHSYLRFYYLVGIGYHIRVSRSVSIPFGLYYRYQDYRDAQPFSLRLGVKYDL